MLKFLDILISVNLIISIIYPFLLCQHTNYTTFEKWSIHRSNLIFGPQFLKDSASCHHLGSIQLAENILTRVFHMNATPICMGKVPFTPHIVYPIGSFCDSMFLFFSSRYLSQFAFSSFIFLMPLSNCKLLRIAVATD